MPTHSVNCGIKYRLNFYDVKMKRSKLEMPNEEGLYTPEEWNGLLTDKQNEVRTRQEVQAEHAAARVEIATLNARIKSLESSPNEEELGNLDETVTRKDLLNALKKQRAELKDEYAKDKETMTQKQKEEAIEKSFDKARDKMTIEKMGKGLSFDEVWEGTKRMLIKKPALREVIKSSKNPGQEAYEIGLQDEVIAKRAALSKKNFPEGERIPKVGLDSTEVPAQYFSQERVSKMSEAEIAANLPAIRESQKKWKKNNKKE